MAQGLGFTSYVVENDLAFDRAVNRAAKEVQDLSIPFAQVAQDFQKSRKAIFVLKGPGQYPDLSPKYKKAKEKVLGSPYPILRFTGRLEESVTNPEHPENVTRIDPLSLELGTEVPYGVYHQSDEPRKKIPLRKFLFIGPESTKFADNDLIGFPERALNTINSHVLRVLGKTIEQATGVKPQIKQERK